MQLQINTTQNEGNKMQALLTNVDLHSPILIQYYIQNLIHMKALDEFHLQKLIKMFNNSKSKINIDFTVTNETGYQFNAQQIIIEFKHTSNLQKLLKANVKIVQNTKTYAEMKEILELMLKSVVQAAQYFIKQQKQYSGFVAFWCGKELSQIGKNAESPSCLILGDEQGRVPDERELLIECQVASSKREGEGSEGHHGTVGQNHRGRVNYNVISIQQQVNQDIKSRKYSKYKYLLGECRIQYYKIKNIFIYQYSIDFYVQNGKSYVSVLFHTIAIFKSSMN
ncbi:Hypothetical_protein [Hexamita inflata]|uniref:Hypothetical_protein n=1 Tax=Hexamita inflata TaxID=28002 RepID=A0AA86UER2_9EUKA|nr:Hypothetical protein HINF_LOCUS35882 [Hexamita inflata]